MSSESATIAATKRLVRPSRWRWLLLLPIALFLTACPYGVSETPSVEWTFVNDTDSQIFVDLVEPPVGGWTLLDVGETRVDSYSPCVLPAGWQRSSEPCPIFEGSEFLFRAHVLDPGRGRWGGSGGLSGGEGEPIGCYVVPWSVELADRIVRIEWQEERNPNCWGDDEWVIANFTGAAVHVVAFDNTPHLMEPRLRIGPVLPSEGTTAPIIRLGTRKPVYLGFAR